MTFLRSPWQIFTLLVCLIFSTSSVVALDQKPANFVIIIADDLGWDDSSPYGNAQVQTPNLERLAAGGIRFDNAFLTCSSCSPSRASILTGRWPHNTGAHELHMPVPADQVLLSKSLKESGYYTASSGKWHLGEEVKDQFDSVHETKGGSGCLGWQKVIQERPKEKPFFFWFASSDPHRNFPRNSNGETLEAIHDQKSIEVPAYYPNTLKVREDFAAYYDEVSRLDQYVGVVIDELKKQEVLDHTFILFMSDNGRPFPQCKTKITDSGIKTPFIVHYPPLAKGSSTTNSLVSSLDIAPTICEIAQVPVADSFQGISFKEVLAAPETKINDFIYAEHNWHDFQAHERGIRDERYTYIVNNLPSLPATPPADAVRSLTYQVTMRLQKEGKLTETQAIPFQHPVASEELYDNVNDPLSLQNLATDPNHAQRIAKMRTALTLWQAETKDFIPSPLTSDLFDRDTGLNKHKKKNSKKKKL